ncbi:hypothetical protein HOD88_00120 [archaeon]|jgi:hypothetical protein|nr:hypothetical protein [archaeon]
MVNGVVFLVISALVIVIWVLIEFKRLEHKLFAYFLIGMILVVAASFSVVTSNYDIDYGSASGLMTAGKVYFSWIGSVFGNAKTMTSHAIKLDWEMNESVEQVDLKKSLADSLE